MRSQARHFRLSLSIQCALYEPHSLISRNRRTGRDFLVPFTSFSKRGLNSCWCKTFYMKMSSFTRTFILMQIKRISTGIVSFSTRFEDNSKMTYCSRLFYLHADHAGNTSSLPGVTYARAFAHALSPLPVFIADSLFANREFCCSGTFWKKTTNIF